MNLVERVKAILLQPKSEWPVIEREPGDAGYLFSNYVAILAAIPPVCSFIGTSIIGFGPFRVGIVSGLIHAIVVYVLTLVGVFVVAYVIDFLAGVVRRAKNLDNAMKVSAYAPTAAWVAGVFNIIPALAILGILGLYSLYLLHNGLAALIKIRRQARQLISHDCRRGQRDRGPGHHFLRHHPDHFRNADDVLVAAYLSADILFYGGIDRGSQWRFSAGELGSGAGASSTVLQAGGRSASVSAFGGLAGVVGFGCSTLSENQFRGALGAARRRPAPAAGRGNSARSAGHFSRTWM